MADGHTHEVAETFNDAVTAQINDSCFHRQIDYSITGWKWDGREGAIFDPAEHGLEPVMIHTACWRGFYLHYRIEDERLFLEDAVIGVPREIYEPMQVGEDGPVLFGKSSALHSNGHSVVFESMHQPMEFTGELMLATGFISKLYVHMGHHPAWKYEAVWELRFENGRLVGEADRSEEMRVLREQYVAEEGKRPRLKGFLEE